MTVADLKPGDHARITAIHGSGAVRQRLLDMGLLPNSPLSVQRIAPAGDPIWIAMRGWQVALRRSEAGTVRVEHES